MQAKAKAERKAKNKKSLVTASAIIIIIIISTVYTKKRWKLFASEGEESESEWEREIERMMKSVGQGGKERHKNFHLKQTTFLKHLKKYLT